MSPTASATEDMVATTKIIVIRHAEKPNGEAGVMPDGTENPER